MFNLKKEYKMRTTRNLPGLMVDFPTVLHSFFPDELFRPIPNKWSARPAVNIAENENSYGIEVAAPGFDKNEFNIKIENNQLIISAVKNEEVKNETTKYTVREFNTSSFERTFNLPENQIDEDHINANYDNGILKVLLPKREEAKPKAPKQIAVQ